MPVFDPRVEHASDDRLRYLAKTPYRRLTNVNYFVYFSRMDPPRTVQTRSSMQMRGPNTIRGVRN
jgi:hypothetical protein